MKKLSLLLVSALALLSPGLVVAEPVPATPAPAWTLKDVNGNAVSSKQFHGKVVVIDFWATWCGPCRAEIPGYIELQKKYGQDLVIVGISLDDGPAVVKQFVQKFGVNYQIVMGDEPITKAFGDIRAIPTTFIIDRAGKIRDRKEGAEATADFEKRLVAILKGV